MLDKSFRHPHRAHCVDGEHLRPGLVVNVSNDLASRADNASVIEQEVDGLSIEFSCRRVDAVRISDIHSQYPQFVVGLLGKSVQSGSSCWITTSCVDPPSISKILTSELKPESSIGTSD
jgi:hypothetical protein